MFLFNMPLILLIPALSSWHCGVGLDILKNWKLVLSKPMTNPFILKDISLQDNYWNEREQKPAINYSGDCFEKRDLSDQCCCLLKKKN